jgi:hypothetical protein
MIVIPIFQATKMFAFEAAKNRFQKRKQSWKDVILQGVAEDGTWTKLISFDAYISYCGTGENAEWLNFINRQLEADPNFRFKILMY